MEQKVREGDFLETREGLIFDVKGLIHPPDRIIAYLRYYPDPSGGRMRDGTRYKKVYPLEERYEFLENNYPRYLFSNEVSGARLQGVPHEDIKRIFRPEELVKKLLDGKGIINQQRTSSLLSKAFKLVKLIKLQSGINYENIGITGSVLVGLETDKSDIDLIIYGSDNAYRVKEALKTLFISHQDVIQPYSKENIVNLYEFRGKGFNIPFEVFLKIERRKKLQGIFNNLDFYIRCIKDWNEIKDKYGEIRYESMGIATIRGFITDDLDSILTPCRYVLGTSETIDGPELLGRIQEIVSFRGRFCEQAQKGEKIEARGRIELVKTANNEYFRLLIGNSLEDYLTVLNI